MQQLVQGIHSFQQSYFPSQRELFEKLAKGQNPETLFITCSDSRIDPCLLTQTRPGDLFIIRNAGNIIPPYRGESSGEGATIEYAVSALGVKHIIVCGHSHCGAMQGLLAPESVKGMSMVQDWLKHAEPTRRIMQESYGHLKDNALLMATVGENVLIQLENLRTLPFVAKRLAEGELSLYAWVYKLETGVVFGYDPAKGQFLPLERLIPVNSRQHAGTIGYPMI